MGINLALKVKMTLKKIWQLQQSEDHNPKLVSVVGSLVCASGTVAIAPRCIIVLQYYTITKIAVAHHYCTLGFTVLLSFSS